MTEEEKTSDIEKGKKKEVDLSELTKPENEKKGEEVDLSELIKPEIDKKDYEIDLEDLKKSPIKEKGKELDLSDLSIPKKTESIITMEKGIISELWDKFFGKTWPMWIGCIILSLLSIGLFIIKSPWGSSGGILNWGYNILDRAGMAFDESQPNGITTLKNSNYGMLSFVMLVGAFAGALMSKEFAIRVAPKGELLKGFIGGALMGIGAIIGMGCTIGNFYSGWPALSGGAFIFTLGLFIGVFIAVKYILWELDKYPGISSGKSCTFLASPDKGSSWQPLTGIIIIIISVAVFFNIYNSEIETEKVLLGFSLIGLTIGVVLQRSRFCIVRSLREVFMTGNASPSIGIMAGILVGLIGFTTIKIMGVQSETSMVASNFYMPSIVGGIIFGFGMTIAGGCTVGSTWRAGEGHVKLMLSLVGLIIFLPLTAEYIKPGFMDMLPDSMKKAEFLPDTFTYKGAFIIVLLIIIIWYIFVKWNEREGKLSAL